MTIPAAAPLLRRFPALRALSPVSLCELPTPVASLSALGDHAWVKRDDLTRTDQGGNKPRKLEFVLADMRRRKARRVVTLGATGTNAGVATALLCRQEGLSCEILTFPQPNSAVVQRNQRAMREAGARLTPRASLLAAALCWYIHPRRLDPWTYFLYAGCSAPVATFAYVNAVLELAEQIENGELPAPAHIVVAAGSGATVAGLMAGAALALPQCTIHAVQVAPAAVGPIKVCHPQTIARLADQAWRSLASADSTLPAKRTDNMVWHGSYLGGGYGESTPAAQAAMVTGAASGLTLETTYSAKSFAAFLNLLQENRQPVLFWQTYSEVQH